MGGRGCPDLWHLELDRRGHLFAFSLLRFDLASITRLDLWRFESSQLSFETLKLVNLGFDDVRRRFIELEITDSSTLYGDSFV